MDALTFSSDVIRSLAWPVAGVGIAAILRRDISALLRRLKLFRAPGGWEAEFEQLDKVREQTDQLLAARRPTPAVEPPPPVRSRAKKVAAPPTSPAPVDPLGDKIATVNIDRLLQLADISPSAAITESWSAIERELVEQARARDLAPPEKYVPIQRLIPELAERSETVAAIRDSLDQLRRIRNNAAHARDEPLSREAAVDYVLTAARVLALLRSAA